MSIPCGVCPGRDWAISQNKAWDTFGEDKDCSNIILERWFTVQVSFFNASNNWGKKSTKSSELTLDSQSIATFLTWISGKLNGKKWVSFLIELKQTFSVKLISHYFPWKQFYKKFREIDFTKKNYHGRNSWRTSIGSGLFHAFINP